MNQTLHIEFFGYFPYILIYYERVKVGVVDVFHSIN